MESIQPPSTAALVVSSTNARKTPIILSAVYGRKHSWTSLCAVAFIASYCWVARTIEAFSCISFNRAQYRSVSVTLPSALFRNGNILRASPSDYVHSFQSNATRTSAKNRSIPLHNPQNITVIRKQSARKSALQRSSQKRPILARLGQLRNRVRANQTSPVGIDGSMGLPSQRECDQVLADCVALDEWELVLETLDLMKSVGLSQQHSTYLACLEACFPVANAASAKEILYAMEQAGVEATADDMVWAILIYCRASSMRPRNDPVWLPLALQLIQEHPNVSVAAYDAVLSCMVETKQWKEAVRLLRGMEQQGSTGPALSTYRFVLESCVASDQPTQAVQVLQSCIHHGLVPTLYSFELVIGALAQKMQWRRALQLVELMRQIDVSPNLVVYNAVLSACSKAKEFLPARRLLHQMRREGVQPSIRSFNAVIAACASAGQWQDAIQVLDQCHREPGIQPDIYTYTNVMRACAKAGKTRKALTLLQVIKDKKLPLDAYAYTAAIEACAKASMSRKALELLGEMEGIGIAPSGVTYSVAITACGNGGEWEKALGLLDTMRQKNLKINLITYNAAITAISKAAKKTAKNRGQSGKLHRTVMRMLDQMREDGIEPDGFSFSAAISCCGSEGHWKEALELMDIMQKGGPRTTPNKIAYTAAIASCGQSGQADEALRLFRQMKDQGLSVDRVAYNAVFSALRIAKRADLAFDLWAEMVDTKPFEVNSIAVAKLDEVSTPDIITVTDAIGALSSASDTVEDRYRVDKVFAEAVRRNIVLRSDTLDSKWEIDLSGMSFPVARAACRYVITSISKSTSNREFEDLTFITGVGVGKSFYKGSNGVPDLPTQQTSLQKYVQQILISDFHPEIESYVPSLAKGTICIGSESICKWAERQ
jgi:pentatricopeptide repeat protein